MAQAAKKQETKTQTQPQQQWDNTNKGAVYPTAQDGVLDGPMNYFGQDCRAQLEKRSKDSKDKYMLTITKGQTTVAQGLLAKSGGEDSLKAEELHKPPRFRGVLKDTQDETKTLPIALWFAHHDERDSDYFQIRSDTQFVAANLREF